MAHAELGQGTSNQGAHVDADSSCGESIILDEELDKDPETDMSSALMEDAEDASSVGSADNPDSDRDAASSSAICGSESSSETDAEVDKIADRALHSAKFKRVFEMYPDILEPMPFKEACTMFTEQEVASITTGVAKVFADGDPWTKVAHQALLGSFPALQQLTENLGQGFIVMLAIGKKVR